MLLPRPAYSPWWAECSCLERLASFTILIAAGWAVTDMMVLFKALQQVLLDYFVGLDNQPSPAKNLGADFDPPGGPQHCLEKVDPSTARRRWTLSALEQADTSAPCCQRRILPPAEKADFTRSEQSCRSADTSCRRSADTSCCLLCAHSSKMRGAPLIAPRAAPFFFSFGACLYPLGGAFSTRSGACLHPL